LPAVLRFGLSYPGMVATSIPMAVSTYFPADGAAMNMKLA
jgi:hypothetical protein